MSLVFTYTGNSNFSMVVKFQSKLNGSEISKLYGAFLDVGKREKWLNSDAVTDKKSAKKE